MEEDRISVLVYISAGAEEKRRTRKKREKELSATHIIREAR